MNAAPWNHPKFTGRVAFALRMIFRPCQVGAQSFQQGTACRKLPPACSLGVSPSNAQKCVAILCPRCRVDCEIGAWLQSFRQLITSESGYKRQNFSSASLWHKPDPSNSYRRQSDIAHFNAQTPFHIPGEECPLRDYTNFDAITPDCGPCIDNAQHCTQHSQCECSNLQRYRHGNPGVEGGTLAQSGAVARAEPEAP